MTPSQNSLLDSAFSSKARYSSKYYGLGKGISAYTYNANWLPLCTKIIGANEHESGYLLDG